MYPIVDSVQIHASGNCCRTRVTGVTSFGIPAWGAPAAAVPVTAAAAVGMGPAHSRGASGSRSEHLGPSKLAEQGP